MLNKIERAGQSLQLLSAKLKFDKAFKVASDPGVLFSSMHAIIFSQSPSPVVQGLGYASLGLTVAVTTLREHFKGRNQQIAAQVNPLLERWNQPAFDKPTFPLYLNGVVLGGVAVTAGIMGDWLSAAISGSYTLANAGKGAQVAGAWSLNDITSRLRIEKIPGFRRLSEYTLSLPEFWGSAGALIYGIAYSNGLLSAVGALSASVAVVAAKVNNGKPENTGMSELVQSIPFIRDRIKIIASDQVLSRRFMKFASSFYAAGAAWLGNPGAAAAHGFAAVGNHRLERADLARQMQALEKAPS